MSVWIESPIFLTLGEGLPIMSSIKQQVMIALPPKLFFHAEKQKEIMAHNDFLREHWERDKISKVVSICKKKGSRKDCSTYRGVSLFSYLWKQLCQDTGTMHKAK